MHHLIEATNGAIAQRNWYAALTLALSMPDICGSLSDPKRHSQARYVAWFEKYLLPAYRSTIGPDRQLHTFLGGSDCYALRCAYLHQGEFGTIDQKAHIALTRFQFIAPNRSGNVFHMNQSNDVLQLQIDIFCTDVCNGVIKWMADVANDQEIQARIANMGEIH